MTQQQSLGECYLCGKQFAKGLMTRHLSKCGQPKGFAAPGKQETPPALHLVVEGRWAKAYWIHVAVPTMARLSKLDKFLRHIWLDCCGHLSAFDIGGIRYAVSPMEDERAMRAPLGRVVDVGTKFLYEYDYGSTTALSLKVVGFWDRALLKNDVELLARNDPPQVNCDKCGTQPATLICTGCEGIWLCEPCAEAHDCEDSYRLPVVNSPRTGVCAYSG